MQIRKAKPEDLDRILQIYSHARAFMAAHGNPRQWRDVWPPEELIRQDIRDQDSYVCEEDGRVVAVFYYIFGKDIEPTYADITEGAWKDDSPYGVVHRIASSGEVRGAGSFCLQWAYEQSGHLRIDTHGDNWVMQDMLKKNGFVYCGTIYVVEDNDPRRAYEKSPRI